MFSLSLLSFCKETFKFAHQVAQIAFDSILVQVDGIALRLSNKQLGKPDFSFPTCCICFFYHFGRNLLKNKPMSWNSPRVRLSKPFKTMNELVYLYCRRSASTCSRYDKPASHQLLLTSVWHSQMQRSAGLSQFAAVAGFSPRWPWKTNKLADSCLVRQLLKCEKARDCHVKTSDAVHPHARCLTEGCERKMWHGK